MKLRDPRADPARPDVLHDLSRQAGLSLTYVRPISGGAHVLLIEGGTEPEAIAGALRRLRASPEVEYIEPDQMMRRQPLQE